MRWTLVLLLLVGCSKADAPVQAVPVAAQEHPDIQASGRTWKWEGEHRDFTSASWKMSASVYSCDDPKRRLIEYRGPSSNGVDRMIREQILNDSGEWVDHGINAKWDTDGSRTESWHWQGESHGHYIAWHPNGQLRFIRPSIFDKDSGITQEWWPNGQLQYWSIYADGKEYLSSGGFEEDGTPSR